MEHEGRLYLVDTGCPTSFAINGVIPWVDRTPHAVVLDMEEGRLRFAGENDEVSRCGLVLPFTKAPGTQAPILRCHPGFKMIWDTGAQVGYIDISTVPKESIIKEMGAFSDFSPTYRTIESPMTWLARFNPEPDFSRSEFVPYIHCQMADARADILADIRKEGAHGVLGNSWMGDKDSLTRMLAAARGEYGELLMDCNEGVIVAICGRKGLVRIQNLPVWIERNTSTGAPRGRPNHDPFEIVAGDNRPVTPPAQVAPNQIFTVARRVPPSLGRFTAEGLRGHIQLDNIDGLIGNDLLQDTLL
ncbi:hypothetical protein EMGBS10_01530 [Opitutia bacterium]|nr:hypothetical protein EMGBS10_01530 [Opitutae bacterium]